MAAATTAALYAWNIIQLIAHDRKVTFLRRHYNIICCLGSEAHGSLVG